MYPSAQEANSAPLELKDQLVQLVLKGLLEQQDLLEQQVPKDLLEQLA
jgi:hypothetical protein